MDQILSTTAAVEEQIAIIKTEATEAQSKGVFSYARSKEIRKAALEIAKLAKELRTVTLDAFKAQKGE